MNSNSLHTQDNARAGAGVIAGSRSGGKELNKMLEEMKERDYSTSSSSFRSQTTESTSTPNKSFQSSNKQSLGDFFSDIDQDKTISESLPQKNSQSQSQNQSQSLSSIFRSNSPDIVDQENYDTIDHATTNLYLGNLCPMVTEELLFAIFSKFGEINSVKIMWPRTEEERQRKRNCGFVSFKNRNDAQEAITELNNSILYDYQMSVGWGKSVKIGNTPFVLPPTYKSQSSILNDVKTFFSQFHKTSSSKFYNYDRNDNRNENKRNSNFDSSISQRSQTYKFNDNDPKVVVSIPSDSKIKRIIDETAKFVADNGDKFEQIIKRREEKNPDYNFLNISQSPLHNYYRWRTYAYLMGDSDDTWSTEPFLMTEKGFYWIPPLPINSFTRESGQKQRNRSYSDDNSSRSTSRSRSGDDSPEYRRKERERSRDRNYDKNNRDRKRSRSPVEYNRKKARSESRSWSRSKSRSRSRSRSPYRSRDTTYNSDVWMKDREKRKDSESLVGLTGAQIERARAAMRRNGRDDRLDNRSYYAFKDMLDNITIERESIKMTMGYAFDHLDAYQEVVDLIRDSIIYSNSPPPPLLVARLYLISDILHNSGTTIKNASHYRSAIQLCLPEIFYFFQEYLPTLSGRFTTKQFTDRINTLLLIWSDWAIFPTAYINGLETMLNQTELDLQQFMTYTPSQIELDEDIYTLKRHAKFHGISSNLEIYFDKFGNLSNEEVNNVELREKYVLCRLLACIKNYIKVKENPKEIENTSVEIIEEIDGVPVDIGILNNSNPTIESGNQFNKVEESSNITLPVGKRDGWVSIEINNENEIENENDDIDGVPLDEGESSYHNTYDDDDIDGVPLDDNINNFNNNNNSDNKNNNDYNEDDDIDGIPLPDDM